MAACPNNTVTKVVKVQPPDSLIKACQGAKKDKFVDGDTNNDLINWGLDWRQAAKECASQINRLIQWYKDDTPQPAKK